MIENLDPEEVFEYLKIIRELPVDEEKLKIAFSEQQLQHYLLNSPVHKILSDCDEKPSILDQGSFSNLLKIDKVYIWLCSYINENIDIFSDPTLARNVLYALTPDDSHRRQSPRALVRDHPSW